MLTNQFPGVHVKEIPSGARPIASIATSNTVFIDVFRKGPLDEAVRLTSFADFERIFGGVWGESEASYAIQQYYQNGGAVAFVIRVGVKRDEGDAEVGTTSDVVASTYTVTTTLDQADGAAQDALEVTAINPGTWGDDIRVGIATRTAPANTYDLLIRSYKGSVLVAEEVFQELSTSNTSPRFADDVVNGASDLVTVDATNNRMPVLGIPNAVPADEVTYTLEELKELPKTSLHALSGGGDGYTPSSGGWQARTRAALIGSQAARTGMYALEDIVPDIFNIMCLPVCSLMSTANAPPVYEAAEKFCRDRFAFLLIDPKDGVEHGDIYNDWFADMGAAKSRNAAGYYPRLTFDDPENPGTARSLGPSGMVAGMMSKIDGSRGIWKSTAGVETLYAGGDPEYLLTDLEQEPLNRLGVNAIRSFPVYGNIIWGARTLAGADDLADEYKYIAVRRTALFIQQSLQRGLKWTVFEGNDENLWGQIRMNVGAFMQGLHRQGAFQGNKASDAYLVKCDSDTTTQGDIDLGIVNLLVAFAPLKPAEFVVLNFQQLTKISE